MRQGNDTNYNRGNYNLLIASFVLLLISLLVPEEIRDNEEFIIVVITLVKIYTNSF